MHLSLINPHIRVAMQSIIPSGKNISSRIIYDYELIYLEKGEFTFVYSNTQYHCQKGDLIFIRPGISHSFIIEHGEISQPHVHFDITYRSLSEKIPVSFKDISQLTETELNWIHNDYFSSYPPTPFINISNKEDFLSDFFKIISKTTDAMVKKSLIFSTYKSVFCGRRFYCI